MQLTLQWCMFTLLTVSATVLQLSSGAPATTDVSEGVQISIKLPEGDEVVKTDVPKRSAIPACLRQQPGTVEDENGLVVSADAFTNCAKTELTRLQTEINNPDNDDSSEEAPEDDDAPPVKKEKEADVPEAKPAPKEEAHPEEKPPQKETESAPKPESAAKPESEAKPESAAKPESEAKPESAAKPAFAPPPKIPDLTSITDAFSEVRPISQDPSVLGEIVKILQVIFDFKRVINDMQRILHGDLKGVLREYPERARGFFKLVHNLHHRFKGAAHKVEVVQRSSNKESKYYGVLDNLHKYLRAAATSSEDLPNAVSLVSTVDALRTVAIELQSQASAVAGRSSAAAIEEAPKASDSESSRVLNDIKNVFLLIPDTFRSYTRRTKLNGGPGIFSPSPLSPLSPYSPLNPLSPIGPFSAIGSLNPLNPVPRASRRYNDLRTSSLRAVDSVSKTLLGLFSNRDGGSRRLEDTRDKE
uniref:Putative conserved secreted protein n=1 Tax=Ixodes ricinus TaxID=34613 RepID=A0A6B0VDD2_IXORI